MLKNHSFLIVLFFICNSLWAATLRCNICGMSFDEKAKTRVETEVSGKPVVLCSYACAHKLRKKFKSQTFHFHDLNTDEKVEGSKAFFIANSTKVVKELDFNMPPSVAAFKNEADAKKKQKQLGDGVVVNGFEKLEAMHE